MQQNISQDKLARLTGYTSRTSISKIEKGEVDLTQTKIMAFAKALNTTPSKLMGWDSEESPIFKIEDDSSIITIPFISQKLSAGTGYDYLSDNDLQVKKIDILSSMAKGVQKSSLVAAEAKGNSMIGEKIYSGDIVVFSRGLIKGEGIYVINYAGDVMVKKIAFDPLTQKVDIISANPDYPTKTVDAEYVSVIGKVVGWFHMDNY